MNAVDRAIRNFRISQAIRYVRPGSRVLDIGCHDGELFRRIGPALRSGLGLDPELAGPLDGPGYELKPGSFPKDFPGTDAPFDVITMLAVLEHIPSEELAHLADACFALLVSGGRLIATVPSHLVDPLLDILGRLRIIDGMQAHEHHGFDPGQTVPIMERAGFVLIVHRRFQFGLNNLFVFERPWPSATPECTELRQRVGRSVDRKRAEAERESLVLSEVEDRSEDHGVPTRHDQEHQSPEDSPVETPPTATESAEQRAWRRR